MKGEDQKTGGETNTERRSRCPEQASRPMSHDLESGEHATEIVALGASRPVLRARAVAAWGFGIAGLASYNWWVLLPLKPGLLRSPSELLSDLEVTGQPYATAMQHADFAAGVLLLAAFLAAGSRSIPGARREWLALMVFAAGGLSGGVFPEVCADGINPVCRAQELRLQLPLEQYLHMVAGIVEFSGITVALLFAFQRTQGGSSRIAHAYRLLWRAAWIGYPLLGGAYLFNRLGAVMEMLFFVGFAVVIISQLIERTRGGQSGRTQARPTVAAAAEGALRDR